MILVRGNEGPLSQHPDEFLLDLCDRYTVSVLAQIIQEQAADLKNPPQTPKEVLGKLAQQVPTFAHLLEKAIADRDC
ncbi:MAG: hypothetical protein LRZ84_08500 [Desertifilum sp.]|nr:hypothetical protein [Desertifilum sp.]